MGAYDDDELKNNLDVLRVLDEAIEQGPWDHSLFFRTIGKELKQIRDRFANENNLLELVNTIVPDPDATQTLTAPAGYVPVYISLYLADGSNLKKWQTLLSTINTYSISRPTYKTERDIKATIRAKENKLNDAYALVWVKETDVSIPVDKKQPVDRYGHELLLLKQGAVQSSNIVYFVHVSGLYKYIDGGLVRQGNIELLENF